MWSCGSKHGRNRFFCGLNGSCNLSQLQHQHFEDIQLMADTCLEAFRFSISWSRLIPIVLYVSTKAINCIFIIKIAEVHIATSVCLKEVTSCTKTLPITHQFFLFS
ncbi:putative beta-glucosidase [Helianthus annuus]|nr:putative beta-glucosidase [Helianthus annuus]KAJ0618931.1 putative beta-glucosidase [Helianthus annuus]